MTVTWVGIHLRGGFRQVGPVPVAEVQATGFYSIAELAFVGSISCLSRHLCGRKMQMVGAVVVSCSNTSSDGERVKLPVMARAHSGPELTR